NDRTDGINRIFKYVHAGRERGQRLKKRNRKAYYALKYLCISAIFAALLVPAIT
ncbi:lipid A hydroxylase LpxO, partial [Escherichia coli]|nr:lipid A hydroxylase LpxO [Escherichia coli]